MGVIIKSIWLIKSFLFIPYYNYDKVVMPVLWQGWTLNIELLFYGTFSLSLCQKIIKYRIIGVTFTIFCLVVLGYTLTPHNAILKTYTNGVLIEFVFGVWLAWAYTCYNFKNINIAFVVVLFALAAGIAGASMDQFGSEWRGVTVGAAAVFIVLGALILEDKGYVPFINSLRFLGDASYSIYLWHTLSMIIVYPFWIRFGFNNGATGAVVLTVAGVTGGIAAYLVIEKPLLAVGKRLFAKKKV